MKQGVAETIVVARVVVGLDREELVRVALKIRVDDSSLWFVIKRLAVRRNCCLGEADDHLERLGAKKLGREQLRVLGGVPVVQVEDELCRAW